jgi:hypothetical protein
MSIADSSVDEKRRFAGPEKREYPRIPVNYPICIRFVSASGQTVERYAQTRNVSVEGVLFSSMEKLEPGMKVTVHMGIPSAFAASLPAAQLNGEAVVVRSERVNPLENEGFGSSVALKFTNKPYLTTEVSMFD